MDRDGYRCPVRTNKEAELVSNAACQQKLTHGYPLWLPLMYFPAQIINKHTAKKTNTQFNCCAHVLIAYWCLYIFILCNLTVRKFPILYLWQHTMVLNHPRSVKWHNSQHTYGKTPEFIFSQESLASDQRIRCYVCESHMDLLKALRAKLTSTVTYSWLKILKGPHFVHIYSVYTKLCDFQRNKCRWNLFSYFQTTIAHW